MPTPLEDSASQETIWDFDVSTALGILNTPDLRPILSIEESFGCSSSPNKRVLSSAPSGLVFWRNESKKPN